MYALVLMFLAMSYLSIDELELRTPRQLANEASLVCSHILLTEGMQKKLNDPGYGIERVIDNMRYLTNVLAVARKKTGGRESPWAKKIHDAVYKTQTNEDCLEGLRISLKMYPKE